MTDSNSIASSNSSGRRASFYYVTCDYSLVLFQRLLLCLAILLGYDMGSDTRTISGQFLIRPIVRIIRNFFYITKAIRKWLSINYNDGIIPQPPVINHHASGVTRSTPKDSRLGNFGGSLKHSPIQRCYTEPPQSFDLATAFKERNKEAQLPQVYPMDSTDFLGYSSLSLKSLMHSLYQSFAGHISDPDEEEAKKAEMLRQANVRECATIDTSKQPDESQSQIIDEAEIKRRTDMVSESVIEHAKKLNTASAASYFNDNRKVENHEPIPVLTFDESSILTR